MIQNLMTFDFGERTQATGVKTPIGVNAYIEDQDPFYTYTILIDPSSMSDDEESKLEVYSLRCGLRIVRLGTTGLDS